MMLFIIIIVNVALANYMKYGFLQLFWIDICLFMMYSNINKVKDKDDADKI